MILVNAPIDFLSSDKGLKSQMCKQSLHDYVVECKTGNTETTRSKPTGGNFFADRKIPKNFVNLPTLTLQSSFPCSIMISIIGSRFGGHQ